MKRYDDDDFDFNVKKSRKIYLIFYSSVVVFFSLSQYLCTYGRQNYNHNKYFVYANFFFRTFIFVVAGIIIIFCLIRGKKILFIVWLTKTFTT